jgi:hypothetical protein
MNYRHLLPPVVAVITGGVWLNHLATERGSLADGNQALRVRIAAAKGAAGVEVPESLAEQQVRGGKTTASGKRLSAELWEWKHFAELQLEGDAGAMQNLRQSLRLQSRLKKMSAAEILAMFDELAAADLSREGLAKIEGMFFDVAAEKDPEMTLRHFENTLGENDNPLIHRVGNTFKKWLGADSSAAIAWLDEMAAAGKFASKRLDGVNQALLNLTGPVISALLDSDPAGSLARLHALPADQRATVLHWNVGNLKPGTELAFAALVRQGLPEGQRASGFCSVANRMASQQGLAAVGNFLDTIGASAEERGKTAASAAAAGLAPLLRQNGTINDLHEWLVAQTPLTADRNAGQAVAANLGQLGFEKAAAMVTGLHAETGSDELLVAFLSASPLGSHGAEALTLANQIKDPTLRERMLSKVILETTKP